MTSQALQTEVEQYLKRHGRPSRVEVLICDCNAIFRGKWFPGSDLEKLVQRGTNFPLSLLFGDLTCETPSSLLQPPLSGDPDGIYSYVPGSLRSVPWRAQSTAQIQLTQTLEPGLDPRDILSRVLKQTGFTGFVALEGEFAVVPHPTVLAGEQVYSHQALEEAETLLAPLYDFADEQSIELTSVLPEYGPGQFEVNQRHRRDPLQAADEYMLAKRVTKAAAEWLGKSASFMALPSTEAAGNGCHIHVSLLDTEGNNLFADDDKMRAAAQGILANVADCVALLAPHANSYRRIDLGGEFNSASASWGENHRGVMLRVPKSDPANRRFEFRLAGADVNPYLLTAFTLAALNDGMKAGVAPTLPKIAEGSVATIGQPIPSRWLEAIERLDRSTFARKQFGDRFIDTYVRMKRAEERKFHALVSDVDSAWAAHVV